MADDQERDDDDPGRSEETSDGSEDGGDAAGASEPKEAREARADEPAEAEPDAGDGEPPPPSGGGPSGPAREPAAWGTPILKMDMAWTRFETWLAAAVLALEIFALSLWVVLKGMSTPAESESAAGIVFRALLGAFVLGMIAYHGLKKRGVRVQRWGSIAGVFIGIFLARSWLSVGVDYSSNLLNWYQQASSLTLFGGLRGIGTRLTLLLALLGGSLATARGKHITIDLVTRFISERARLPVVLVGWIGAAVICFVASWGFFDHIAIENFGAKADATAKQKVETVADELGERFFIFRKQLALDFKSTPHIVFSGETYSEWLKGSEWNQWLKDAGFVDRYGADQVKGLEIPPEDARSPIVVIPGRGEPRGELIHAANLVFPIGLLVIALRFLIRSLLALSGHVSVDPEEGGEFTTDQPVGPAAGGAG